MKSIIKVICILMITINLTTLTYCTNPQIENDLPIIDINTEIYDDEYYLDLMIEAILSDNYDDGIKYQDKRNEYIDNLQLEKEKISFDDLWWLSKIIWNESGVGNKYYNYDDRELCALLVGNVVINRVNNEKYFSKYNTIKDVIFQKGQYSPASNGRIDKIPTRESIDCAIKLLDGERYCPENVIFQSQIEQGDGTWKKIKTPNGYTYFCYKD